MKLIATAVLLAAAMSVSTAGAENIMARAEKSGENTMISCTTMNGDEIERAFLTLYQSDGTALSLVNREMDVSSDNVARFELAGRHQSVSGKCKIFLAEGDIRITREEFSLSMY